VLLALLWALFSCGVWIDRQSYYIDEDVYKPSTPWKQMIWEAKGIVDFRLQIVDLGSEV
jgi:hypothetical protein